MLPLFTRPPCAVLPAYGQLNPCPLPTPPTPKHFFSTRVPRREKRPDRRALLRRRLRFRRLRRLGRRTFGMCSRAVRGVGLQTRRPRGGLKFGRPPTKRRCSRRSPRSATPSPESARPRGEPSRKKWRGSPKCCRVRKRCASAARARQKNRPARLPEPQHEPREALIRVEGICRRRSRGTPPGAGAQTAAAHADGGRAAHVGASRADSDKPAPGNRRVVGDRPCRRV